MFLKTNKPSPPETSIPIIGEKTKADAINIFINDSLFSYKRPNKIIPSTNRCKTIPVCKKSDLPKRTPSIKECTINKVAIAFEKPT